jgi:hypothetical protein
MPSSKKPKKPRIPRQSWDRNPVQRPHSTPKGGKGYDRRSGKADLRREIERLDEE